jgi:hypothetical protein
VTNYGSQVDVTGRLRTLLILGLASSATAIVGAATVGLAASAPPPTASDLACTGNAVMGADVDYLPVVNPASAADTLQEFIDYDMFDLGVANTELSLDVSNLSSTSGNAGVVNADDDVVVVATMDLDGDYGWRIVSWLRCG